MKKSVLACLVGVAAALAIPVALANAVAPTDRVRMERAIDVRVESGQFMGSVVVAVDGEPVLDRAYGLANVALRTPNQPDTRFRVGSVTKQFTAAAILLLEERGKLRIDDPIKKYLPDAPAAWDGITFFHLLTHTSGIPNLTNPPSYRAIEGRPLTPEQLVARFKDLPLDFPAGTSWNYSNSGYLLLGLLIEKISGVSYGRFLHDNIFVPLKMWNSGYDAGGGKIPHQAIGYIHTPDGPSPAPAADLSGLFSAGGLYSTTEDLLRWTQGLYGDKLLRPASLQKMTTPYRNHCAFGVSVEPGRRGAQILSQGGVVDGFNTRLVYVPGDRVTVIVLSNLSGEAADQLATDLRGVVEGERVTLVSDLSPVTLSPAALDRPTGYYLTEEGTLIAVGRKDDHLQAQGIGRVRDLYPQSAREFFATTENVEVFFTDNAEGRIESLLLRLPDRQVHAARIDEADARELSAERDRKLQEQVATPGSDKALRELLDEMVSGNLDMSLLGPSFAELRRRQLPRLQQVLDRLGAIEHTDFLGVAPGTGEDVYLVTFEKGAMEMRICVGPDGRIWSQEMRPWQS